ncbi:hypothetical protein ACO2Q8_00585 [Larkinella sp. VNQ87]|uniref:hypothetical protein n=1 Tax=Larkinella sp. VNQ87 TaxID=3400921 RepID=UPI003C04BDA1
MLTQLEYNRLPLAEKAELLWRYGQHLMNRSSPPFTIGLYAVNDFLVEAYFSESKYYEGNHELQHLFSLREQSRKRSRSQHPFEPYLDQIELNELVRD